jgi:hypothetical protein
MKPRFTIVIHGDGLKMETICYCNTMDQARMVQGGMRTASEALERPQHFSIIEKKTLVFSSMPPDEMARRKAAPVKN